MKKRVIVQRLEGRSALLSRVEKLTKWTEENKNNDQISLRVYTSQDDETLLVEKWGFVDSAAETAFFSTQEHDLGPWPESDHADDHGGLRLFTEKEWDE